MNVPATVIAQAIGESDVTYIARLEHTVTHLESIIARNKTSAVHRLHNICDGLSEQVSESPYTTEEWARIDARTVELQREFAALRAALQTLVDCFEPGKNDYQPTQIFSRTDQAILDARAALTPPPVQP